MYFRKITCEHMGRSAKNREEDDTLDPRIARIAAKLKQLRIGAGYTSHETFAWDHDINRIQYWRIEKGSNITLKTLLAVLDIHKISLADFFKDL